MAVSFGVGMRAVSIHKRWFDMNEAQALTLEQVRQVVAGTQR